MTTPSRPINTTGDVAEVFERAVALARKTARIDLRREREIEDDLFYVGATRPELFHPLQDELLNLPDAVLKNLQQYIDPWLLHGAPDAFVERIEKRLSEQEPYPSGVATLALEGMLEAVLTPAALRAIAAYANRTGRWKEFDDGGFWAPPGARTAVPRFTTDRRALRLDSFDGSVEELAQRPHPVGLPASLVADRFARDSVAWHYCSLTLAETGLTGLPPLPQWMARVPLVSPPVTNCILFYEVRSEGTIGATELLVSSFDSDTMAGVTEEREDARRRVDQGRGELVALPFDDQLVYSNGHILSTPGVEGQMGGPPLGLYGNPHCPRCGVLMFHIALLDFTVREYGDHGFRALFVCEHCGKAASSSFGYN